MGFEPTNGPIRVIRIGSGEGTGRIGRDKDEVEVRVEGRGGRRRGTRTARFMPSTTTRGARREGRGGFLSKV